MDTQANGPYPLAPGHRGTDTSAEAAAAVDSKAELLRKRCLVRVRQAPQHDPGVLGRGKPDPAKTPATNARGEQVGITVREMAALLGQDNDNVNPRMSELRAMGKIRDSGVRRVNQHSGRKAVAWVPGDDPDKPQTADGNAPPVKPALRETYVRGMAAAYHILRSGGAAAVRQRLAELEPGNPEWQA